MQNVQFKSLGQFWQKFSALAGDKRVPTVAMFAALLLLTHSMANLTWKFIPLPEGVSVTSLDMKTVRPAATNINNQAEAEKDKPLAGEIRNMHLFGKFEIKKAEPVPVQQVVEPPKPTRLNLKLRGIFASANKDLARAIIADAKNAEDSYKVGDTLPGGVTLHEIQTDKVILDNRGKMEILLLPEDVAPGTENGNRNNEALAPQSAPAPTPTAQAPGGPLDTANAEPGVLLRDIRDRLVSDPQSVMGLIRAQPFRKNGKLAGYRIRPGQDRQLLEKFGLRSGDVVTAINGVPMDNPLKALELMRDLKSATSLSVDIERRGVPQSLNFSIP